jgi:3-oxoacyl-[acyl-carrier protein] reductase
VKTLAHELPPGITVNNVLPGLHDTDRIVGLADAVAAREGVTPDDVRARWLAQVPERRLGNPDDLGELVAFLCSPAGGYVRGAAIPVDGGRMRSI